jgi:NTE family protein
VGTTAIVTAGAGARGAYEAGALSVLVPRLLLDEAAGEESIVLLGTSAGAINTALLAASTDPAEAIQNMLQVWETTSASDVFAGLRRTAIRDATSYLAELLGRGQINSLLDTAALRRTVEKKLDWGRLRDSLDRGKGWAHGAGIVATSSSSGRTTVFLQGKGIAHPPPDDFRGIDYVPVTLAAPHVLASAAIPIAFLPVRVDPSPAKDGWFVDGGVRLNAPIRPALALGADRVIVVATTPDPDSPHSAPVAPSAPDVFDAGGIVLHALLVDRMAEDVHTLRKTNRFVEAAGKAGALPPAHRDTGQPYRQVQNLFLGPPEAGLISAAANEVFARNYRAGNYRGWFKRLSDIGILGTMLGGSSAESHGEILSFLFFDLDFHSVLIHLGKKHAEEALGAGPGLPWRS